METLILFYIGVFLFMVICAFVAHILQPDPEKFTSDLADQIRQKPLEVLLLRDLVEAIKTGRGLKYLWFTDR